MPTPTEHFPLPLDLLISRLEAAGFRVDTSRRLRVLRVFDDLGNPFVGGHFEELKYLLSPLLSRSPQEQERFYEIFDAFWRECEAEAQQVEVAGVFAEGEKVVDEMRVLAKPKKRWWWWWVGAGVIVVATFAGFFLSTVNEEVVQFAERGLEFNRIMHEGSILEEDAPKDTLTYWEIIEAQTQASLHRDTNDLTWVVTKHGRVVLVVRRTFNPDGEPLQTDTNKIEIHCSNPPEISEITPSAQPPYQPNMEYEFSIKTEPGCRVVWEDLNGASYSDTLTVGATGSSTFRLKTKPASKGTTLIATVYRPENIGYCYTSKTLNIEIGNDKPILPLTPFQRAEGFSVFVISRLGWLLIALPLLLAGWFFYRWRKKRNTPTPQKTPEELAAQYPVLDAGPYFIPYLPQEHSITVPREFFRIAELLRRREEGQRRYFDGPATVRATVESGGFPAWRERAVTRPAEYLFLVERPDERDQQGKLFTRLCDFLKRRDVPLVTFFHDGSFQHFWNAEYADGLPPLELRRRYPHHRLVLLGAAHGLVNPYATRQPELLRGPLDWLTHWPRRLLLTPEPVAAWSFQEALLHRHFLVFPADTEGILSGIDLLDRTEEYHPGRFERWQETRAPRHSPETHRYRTWKTAAEHADYLRHDPDCFRWLCALAVCAQPDWSLTLAIGRAIGVEVTHDRLLLLTRIPWLSQNLPNDGLRLDLLRQLSPADEQAARAAVAHELEVVRSLTANSFAETERTANAAVQNFALDPRDEAHKQAIRELRTLGLLSGSQEAELDFIVQEKADKAGLPNSAGAGIEGWLDVPAPKQIWTWELGAGLLSALFSLKLLLLLYNREAPLPVPFDVLTKTEAQNSELIQLNERAIAIAERVLAVEDYQGWLGLQDSVRVVDSLFQEVAYRAASEQESNLDLNLAIFIYNANSKNFNFYQTESLPADTLRVPLRGFERAGYKAKISIRAGEDSLNNFITKLALDAQHGQGLCYYYLSNYGVMTRRDWLYAVTHKGVMSDTSDQKALLDSAQVVYEAISRNLFFPNYFDSIRATMPVNLQTLLEAEGTLDESKAAASDEEAKSKIVGYWLDESAEGKTLFIFRKNGTARVEAPELANGTMEGPWSVEGNMLRFSNEGPGVARFSFNILRLDNLRLELLETKQKLRLTYRRIQPTDRDRDGVLDVVDNCPDEMGAAENGGCPEKSKGPTVVVSAVNALTKDPVYGVMYRLIEIGGKGAVEEKTSRQGEGSVRFGVSGSRYKIVASKPDWDSDSTELNTASKQINPTFTANLEVQPRSSSTFIPPVLYFDNDQPDTNTNASTTKQAYQPLYIAYYQRKDEYIKQYTAGLSKEAIAAATDSLENFFDEEVKGGWNRMRFLSEVIYEKLVAGEKVELTLRGYTAPKGSSAYNQNLSSRRISSVVNHFLTFDGAILKQFVDSGQLTFRQEPYGESKAPRGISDNEKDLRRSVYSPEAARQNRVEIIEVEVKGKSKN